MPDISIQLHATPEELLRFTAECVFQFELRLAAMQYRPFEVAEIDSGMITNLFSEMPEHRRLTLSRSNIDLDVSNELEFQRANPNDFRIDVGKQTEMGLEESWMCVRTENLGDLKVWQAIARKIRRITHAGVTAINRQNGVAAVYRSSRYSEGAKQLESTGVAMLPSQGPQGPLLKLGLNVEA